MREASGGGLVVRNLFIADIEVKHSEDRLEIVTWKIRVVRTLVFN